MKTFLYIELTYTYMYRVDIGGAIYIIVKIYVNIKKSKKFSAISEDF